MRANFQNLRQSILISPETPNQLDEDMDLICQQFRISPATQKVLSAADACCLEDFALMTTADFDCILISAAQQGHPLPPLQQRKITVLNNWAKALMAEHATTQVPEEEGYESTTDVKKSVVSVRRVELIPYDWEKRFMRDLPRLKQKLRDMGDFTAWSNLSQVVLSLKWLLCHHGN